MYNIIKIKISYYKTNLCININIPNLNINEIKN